MVSAEWSQRQNWTRNTVVYKHEYQAASSLTEAGQYRPFWASLWPFRNLQWCHGGSAQCFCHISLNVSVKISWWILCLDVVNETHDASRWETVKGPLASVWCRRNLQMCDMQQLMVKDTISNKKWISIWRKCLEVVSKSCDIESFRVTAGRFSLSQLVFYKFSVSLLLHQTRTQSMSNTNIPAGVHNPSIDRLSAWVWCSAQLTALYVLRLLWCVSSHRSMSPEPLGAPFCKRLQTFWALLVRRGLQIV